MSAFSTHQLPDQNLVVLLVNEFLKQLTNSASIHSARPHWRIAAD